MACLRRRQATLSQHMGFQNRHTIDTDKWLATAQAIFSLTTNLENL